MPVQKRTEELGTENAMPTIKVVRLLALALLLTGAAAIGRAERPRERISLHEGWRFTQGDPVGANSSELLYDVRPVDQREDDARRRAEDTAEAREVGAVTHQVLKPWILPTGNPFIKDAGKRHVRPEGDPGSDLSYVQSNFDDSNWTPVALPHDWAISGPFNSGSVGGGMGRLPSPGIGWYRRKLDVPPDDAGQSFFLDVDGAMSHAAVWVNGRLVGGWPYGYASWRLDVTPYVIPGSENQIAIRLDNPLDFSRWYPGAGLYRNVWLVKTAPVHVGHWGTVVTTPEVTPQRATVNLRVTVDNDADEAAEVVIATRIFALDEEGRRGDAEAARTESVELKVAAGESAHAESSVVIANPQLWGPPPQQQPNCYVAVTEVLSGDEVVDRYETPFGIRDVAYKPDGLYVNGERIQIQGVNQHHDLGALGAAFNRRAAERQLQILREMGCNAIRTAHNPPAPELLELTDRMGVLVVDEIFDVWIRRKTPFDFHLLFPDWHEPDLRAFIARDRNHPSVILWSMGNEVGEQYTGPAGAEVARQLVAIAHDEDPTRPATASMNFAKPDSQFAAATDVICLNYQGEGIRDTPEFENSGGIRTPPQYDAFHEKFPERTIISSESAAALSSRGTYLFPVAEGRSHPVRTGSGGDPNRQHVSAYELYAADFGSTADKVFAALEKHPFVAGDFVWSGWDYLGEPTPYYGARSSYFGIIDLAGFPKDRYFLYQSHWRPETPVAHILPHWTWPDRVGKVTPVHVFTSGDEAELFLNGKSMGRKKKAPFEYRLRWDEVRYQPGELKVVAYKDGAPWADDVVRTAKAPAKLELAADREVVMADGRDLAFVTLRVTDANGVIAPRADNTIRFSIDGPGEIVATDNGDPTDFTAFPSTERKAFSGLALAIIRADPGHPGAITVQAASEGLAFGKMEIRSRAPENSP